MATKCKFFSDHLLFNIKSLCGDSSCLALLDIQSVEPRVVLYLQEEEKYHSTYFTSNCLQILLTLSKLTLNVYQIILL